MCHVVHRRHIIISVFKRKSSYEVETFKTILPSILPDPLSPTAMTLMSHDTVDRMWLIQIGRRVWLHYICARATHLDVTKRGEEVTTDNAVNHTHESPPGTKVTHTRFDLSPQFVSRRSSRGNHFRSLLHRDS